MIIRGRIWQIFVIQNWYMLIALRVTVTLIPITLDISFISLNILLILDSIYRRLISTRRLYILFRNCVCAMNMLCDLMISLPMFPLIKKICVNTTALLTQNDGNPLILRKRSQYEPSLLKYSSGRLWIKLILKSVTMGNKITLE